MTRADTELCVNNASFVIAALQSTPPIRVDGRTPHEIRPLHLQFCPSTFGLVELHLGLTRVQAHVTAECVRPFADRPNEGTLSFNVDIEPIAHLDALQDPSSTNDQAALLSRRLEQAFRHSGAMVPRTMRLCIVPGVAVWSIKCDVRVLSHSGNMTDACIWAAVAALLHFRMPESVVLDELEMKVNTKDLSTHGIQLPMHHVPLSLTFALMDQGRIAIVDPSLEEERISQGQLTIALNIHGEVCLIHKMGGVAIPTEQFLKCLDRASKVTQSVLPSLQQSISKDLMSR